MPQPAASTIDSSACIALARLNNKTPAALGSTTSAGSLPVVIASDQAAVPIKPGGGSLTDRSSTTTGSAQQVAAANSSRKFLIIQNQSDADMWISFTGTAAADTAGSFVLVAKVAPASAGGSFTTDAGFCPTSAISLICASAGKRFFAQEG